MISVAFVHYLIIDVTCMMTMFAIDIGVKRPYQAVRHAQDHPHWEGLKRDSERIALKFNYKSTRA